MPFVLDMITYVAEFESLRLMPVGTVGEMPVGAGQSEREPGFVGPGADIGDGKVDGTIDEGDSNRVSESEGESEKGSTNTVGTAAGTAVGAVAVIAILVLVFFLRRRRRMRANGTSPPCTFPSSTQLMTLLPSSSP